MFKILRKFIMHSVCASLAMGPQSFAQTQNSAKLDRQGIILRNMVLANYKSVKTFPEFVQLFAKNRPLSERKNILELLSKMQFLPRLEPTEHGILLAEGSIILKIDFRTYEDGYFDMNGQKVILNPKISLTTHAEMLTKKLFETRNRTSGMFSLLIPEAQANEAGEVAAAAAATVVKKIEKAPSALKIRIQTGLSLMGLTVVTAAVTQGWNSFADVAGFYGCRDIIPASTVENNPYLCKEFKTIQAAMLAKKPQAQSVKIAMANPQGPNGEIFTPIDGAEKCPSDTKGKYYNGITKITRTKKLPNQNAQDAIRIYAEFDGDKTKFVKIVTDDYVNGKVVTTELANYVVDNNTITDIIIPNPVVVPDPAMEKKVAPTTIAQKKAMMANAITPNEIKISATADLKDNPDRLGDQQFHLSLWAYFGTLLSSCKLKAQAQEAERRQSAEPKAASDSKTNKPIIVDSSSR
jgi:hypothetical protein